MGHKKPKNILSVCSKRIIISFCSFFLLANIFVGLAWSFDWAKYVYSRTDNENTLTLFTKVTYNTASGSHQLSTVPIYLTYEQSGPNAVITGTNTSSTVGKITGGSTTRRATPSSINSNTASTTISQASPYINEDSMDGQTQAITATESSTTEQKAAPNEKRSKFNYTLFAIIINSLIISGFGIYLYYRHKNAPLSYA